jgi:glycosyltransferase involved in cell wall biosynthesis
VRILIVAFSDSVHTARWLSQIADQGWDIHLFPSIDCGLLHPLMKDVTVYHTVYQRKRGVSQTVRRKGIPVFSRNAAVGMTLILRKIWPAYYVRRLNRIIEEIRPDIIHSAQIQTAGYLTMEAKKRFRGKFPPWIVTNWGSDIYFFRHFPEHAAKIREVMCACDYYNCECQRDVGLAREYGFKGKAFPVFPNAGGFDIRRIAGLRQQGPVSSRRLVMLKGYHHWAGRALVGLQALTRCADMLKGYTVGIYSASRRVVSAAKRFERSTGIRTMIIPRDTPHEEILKMHGRARVSIGLSMGDGLSTSFLEAVAMGSFPVQSWTACADEWIEDGKTGLLVPPEDPDAVGQAIRRALADDAMVDQASELNYRLAEDRLDQALLKPKAVEIYTTVAKERGINN